MNPLLRTTAVLLAVHSLATFVGALSPMVVHAALDTPALTVLDGGQGSVGLEVTAGSSGAPSGFEIQWIARQDYEMLGGWPADPSDPALFSAIFRGQPTLNTSDGTSTFLLIPQQIARVEIGDLFDETGVGAAVRSELSTGTEYYFRVIARPTATMDESAPSGHQGTQTLSSGGSNCTYTQGYWKNHSGAWPVGSVKLGTVTYTKAQLLQIFTTPARGNGLISLSHQLIAAKLNVAGGASLPAAVLTAIQNADALIAGKIVPPIGAGSLSPGTTSSLTQTLDAFNNGLTGPGHCGAVPAQRSTWSDIKVLYR